VEQPRGQESHASTGRGLYIGKYLSPFGGEISTHVIWEKQNMKRGREKGGKFKRKRMKGVRKEKMGSKRVKKQMRNREKLRAKRAQ
jgi:hypothetical protein